MLETPTSLAISDRLQNIQSTSGIDVWKETRTTRRTASETIEARLASFATWKWRDTCLEPFGVFAVRSKWSCCMTELREYESLARFFCAHDRPPYLY